MEKAGFQKVNDVKIEFWGSYPRRIPIKHDDFMSFAKQKTRESLADEPASAAYHYFHSIIIARIAVRETFS